MPEDLDAIIQIDQAYIDRQYAENGKIAPQIFKPGEYVIIKEEMSARDERLIKNATSRVTGSGKNAQVHIQLGDIELVTLQCMIKGWSISRTVMGPTNQPQQGFLPFLSANVENLPRRIYNYIKKEVARLNPDEEVDESGESPLQLSVIDSSPDSRSTELIYQRK